MNVSQWFSGFSIYIIPENTIQEQWDVKHIKKYITTLDYYYSPILQERQEIRIINYT